MPFHNGPARAAGGAGTRTVRPPSLAGIAVRLHALIARSGHPERFVTALLVNFPVESADGGPPPAGSVVRRFSQRDSDSHLAALCGPFSWAKRGTHPSCPPL
jgi:hypothetical protein